MIDYNTLKERIYQHLAAYATKVDGRYNRPWSGDSDSGALALTEKADGSILAYDHVEGQGYNAVTLARRLGIEIPRLASTRRGLAPRIIGRSARPGASSSAPAPDRTEPASASSSSAPDQTPDAPAPDAPAAAYVDLADYATRHGVPVEAFQAAGWRETRSRGYLAFAFPTANGTRYRYADAVAAGSKYGTQRGYKSCWYGIPRALAIAEVGGMDTLLLVNGEPAVVCAQYRGLPAVALTNSGERSTLPPEHLAELRQAWSGRVIVCGDNDAKGRKSAPALAASLRAAGVDAAHLIIPVEKKGADLADWLMTRTLWASADDLAALVDLAEQTRPAAIEPDGIEPAAALAVARPSEVILANLAELGYSFRFNQMAQTVEVNGARLDDQTRAALLVSALDHGLLGRGVDQTMFWSIVRVGAGASTYHPLRQYFDRLNWDGVDHISALLRHIQCDGAVVEYPDGRRTRLLAVYLTRWLIGCVAKVYSSAQNLMLVWSGPQGTGKSALVRWLCDAVGSEYHAEAPLDLDNKDTRFRLLEKFIWEVAELEGVTRKADVNALKHFVTMQTVTERRPYDRYDTTGQAVCSLFGTVNGGNGFLVDDTGNRRFMVSTVQRIDWSYRQLVDPAQLWSQAVALYRAGVSHQLTPVELAHQTSANMAHMAPSTLDDYIAAWFAFDEPDAFLTSGQIETHLRQRGYESFTGGGGSVAQQIRQSMLRVAGRDLAVRTSRQRGYRGVRAVDAPRQPTGGGGRPDQTPDLTGVSDVLPDAAVLLSSSVTHLSQGLAHQNAKVTEVTEVTDVLETFKTSAMTDDGHTPNLSASGVSDVSQKVLQTSVTGVTSVTDGDLAHQDAVARVTDGVTDDDRWSRWQAGQTVVANMKHDADLIAAAMAAGKYTRVDRRTQYGNPHRMASEADRETVIARYRSDLASRPDLTANIRQLRGHVLGCWCYPKACHGDVIAAMANAAPAPDPAADLADDLTAALQLLDLADAYGIQTRMTDTGYTGWLVCVDGIDQLAETADDLRRLITDAIDQQQRRKAS